MSRNQEPPPPTSWPEAKPSPNEGALISVVCGNTHLNWSYHLGAAEDFAPTLFWRTPLMNPSEFKGPPCEILATHLAEQVFVFVFGSVASTPSSESALQASLKRAVPTISVYIVSSNKTQLPYLKHIFQDVPARLYVMQGDDFFTKQQGRYESMGVDRLATLKGASMQCGFPVLVIDGGTATTYTAADAFGKILGGGIGPGLMIKLRSLGDFTEALPHVKYSEMKDETLKALNTGKPLAVFAQDTKHAIISDVLIEMACKVRRVINHFVAQVSGADNRKPTVVLTGGDCDLIEQLLEKNHSNYIEPDPTLSEPDAANRPYDLKIMKHIIHNGVAAVLKEKMEAYEKDPFKDAYVALVGQRVAKRFDPPDETGDHIYRGTIIFSSNEEKLPDFRVRYDDGDEEDLESVKLYASLLLYTQVGEKQTDNIVPEAERGQKIAGAQKAAAILAEQDAAVRENLAKKAEKKAKKKAAGMPPSKPAGRTKGSPKAKPPAAAPAKPPASAKRGTSDTGEGPRKKTRVARAVKDVSEYVDRRIAKHFDNEETGEQDLFFGTIEEFYETSTPGDFYFCIHYDDGDREDLDEEELNECLSLYDLKKSEDELAESQPSVVENQLPVAERQLPVAVSQPPVAPARSGESTDQTPVKEADADSSADAAAGKAVAPAAAPAVAPAAAPVAAPATALAAASAAAPVTAPAPAPI